MRQLATPEAYPDGSRIAHIGLSKTGTTAIQASLHDGRERLQRHGVSYASKSRHAFSASMYAVGSLGEWHRPGAEARWEKVCRRFKATSNRVTLLSSEVLSSALPQRVPGVVSDLGGDFEVLVTLRPLADMLASAWQQALRRGEHLTLDDWLAIQLSPAEGHRDDEVLPRYRISRLLQAWAPVVGEDRITFLVSDPSDRDALLRNFELLLGVPTDTLRPAGESNSSLPWSEAEFLRHFNHAFAEAGRDRSSYMKTVTTQSNTAVSDLAASFPRERIAIPRWAAVRANELTESWLNSVHDSDVRVVGDLGQLIADPDRFPDSGEVPGTVDAGHAGWLAFALYEGVLRSGSRKGPKKASAIDPPSLEGFSSEELVAELRRRARGRLRRG